MPIRFDEYPLIVVLNKHGKVEILSELTTPRIANLLQDVVDELNGLMVPRTPREEPFHPIPPASLDWTREKT